MTKTTKSKMLSFLLCFVMIATTFCQTAMTAQAAGTKDVTVTDAQGTAVQDITLPKNGPKDQKTKLTARAGVSADAKYQWQILADADSELWVDIRGEKAAEISVSYPMVRNLIDKDTGSTSLRCKIKDGSKTLTSDAVKVTAGEKVRVEAAAHPTKAEIRKAAAKTATDPTPQADDSAVNDGEVSNCIVTINYVFENGTQAANPWTASIAKGSDLQQDVTSPTVVGYTPDKEVVNIDINSISEDTTYTVTYKPALVEYTVKHYQQNVDDDKYTLKDTETRKGYTESVVGEGLATTYKGFTALLYDTTTKIASDGSTVVEIYYDRNYYLMTFDLDGGYGVEPIYARYGYIIGDIGTPEKAGYTFNGWDKDIPTEMPVNGGKYTAQWIKGTANLTVVFWYENANDDNYSIAGTYSTQLEPETIKKSSDYKNQSFTGRDDTHFTYNADKAESVTVKGDSSAVLNVYYTRNVYTITFPDVEIDCGKVEHSHSHDQCCTKTGLHWSCNTDKCPVGYEHTHRNSCYGDYTIKAKYDSDITYVWETDPIKSLLDDGYVFRSSVTDKYYSFLEKMPGQDITMTKKKWNGNKYEWYYYLEVLPGQSTDGLTTRTDQGKTYYLYHTTSVYGEGISLTYDEDYFPITGFTQRDKTVPSFDRNNKAYLYYTRNSYDLTFMNYGEEVKSEKKHYQADISGEDFTPAYPSTLEKDAYTFEGWYSDPFFKNKFNFEGATMPAGPLVLYAYWKPVTHTVKCYIDEDNMTEPIPGDKYSQTVSHGQKAEKPATPSNGQYDFAGWFYRDSNGVEKAFDFDNMPVNRDLNLYAKWSSNKLVEYTIRYVLEDGVTEIAPASTGSALAGTTKTFNAKGGDELYDEYKEGYFPETSSHSLTMDINGNNEYKFVYVPRAEVNYTVKYLEKGTNKELVKENTDKTKNAVITETFVPVTGYAPDAYQKRLVLSANEEENVLIFWYTKDDKHAPVRVVHEIQNIAGDGYTEYQSSTNLNGEIGKEYSEDPLTIPGFEYKAEKSTPSGTLTETGLELILKYDRIEYPYEFKFLEQGTDKELADPIKDKARYQAQVTQTAKDIPGYTLAGSENQAINIAIEDPDNVANKNVRVFYYKENDVTINYEVVGTGGSVKPESETLKAATTKEATGSTPTADKGYTFDGWYKDAKCTQPVDKAWVGTGNKLTPGKNSDNVYENATYYAKFKENEVTINYKAVGPDGNIDDSGTYGTVSLKSETVQVKTGKAQGSTPEAKNGYRFVGWYTDEKCTNKVTDSWVDSNNKLTPQKEGTDPDQMYTAATYYAKFEKDIADLKIVKEGWNTADENQSFIFTITGTADTNTAGVENTVIIHKKAGSDELSAVLKDLPVGEYTVTEDTNWSWRYTPKAGDQVQKSQTVTITASSKGDKIVTVTFKNGRTESKWLNGSSWCRNVFKDNKIESDKTTTPKGK